MNIFTLRYVRQVQLCAGRLGLLRCEHLAEDVEDFGCGAWIETAKTSDESPFVDGSDLVQDDLASLFLESTVDTSGVGAATSAHGGHDHRADVPIHLVR